jgi:hypothetical protein
MTAQSLRRALVLFVRRALALPFELRQRRLIAAKGSRGLDARELALLDAVTERLIPADEHAPGAHAAQVAPWLDAQFAGAPADHQARWRSGLRAIDELAQELGHRPFVSLAVAQQDQVLEALARNEAQPKTTGEHFFVELKGATIAAYYTTEIGILQDLGYVGNRPVDHFDGCAHPEHRDPSDR